VESKHKQTKTRGKKKNKEKSTETPKLIQKEVLVGGLNFLRNSGGLVARQGGETG